MELAQRIREIRQRRGLSQEALAERMEAVSYTHLDVYKRQAQRDHCGQLRLFR